MLRIISGAVALMLAALMAASCGAGGSVPTVDSGNQGGSEQPLSAPAPTGHENFDNGGNPLDDVDDIA